MKSQKVNILMNGKYLETCRNEESAKLRINCYEKQDRYTVEVEKYKFPCGMPVYTIERRY